MTETTAPTVPADEWVHVAVTFDGTTFRLFVNGVLGDSGTKTVNSAGSSTRNYINRDIAVGIGGECWLDNFRITDGVARYTSNFTPPTKAFPDS